MKETGLMFKAPLVLAILAGQKTQTRRVVKRLPLRVNREANTMEVDVANIENGEFTKRVPCPMGQPGDRIYVRETWQGPLLSNKEWEDHYFSDEEALPRRFETPAYCQYAADGGPPPEFTTMDDETVARWKPSIHMPKWAARIWLEITGVRVERLQQISRADAIAEGIKFFNNDHECGAKNYLDRTDMDYSLCPTDSFETLWKSTGGDWDANPWVWVIDFKTISTTGRPA